MKEKKEVGNEGRRITVARLRLHPRGKRKEGREIAANWILFHRFLLPPSMDDEIINKRGGGRKRKKGEEARIPWGASFFYLLSLRAMRVSEEGGREKRGKREKGKRGGRRKNCRVRFIHPLHITFFPPLYYPAARANGGRGRGGERKKRKKRKLPAE